MRPLLLALLFLPACSLLSSLDELRGDAGGVNDAGNGDATLDVATVDATSDAPVVVDAGPPRYVDVSVGRQHACAVRNYGDVYCWGSNEFDQVGQPDNVPLSLTAVQVAGISTAVKVSAGEHHTCALLADASVVCWGDNEGGQLGVPLSKTGPKTPTPFAVEGLGGPVLQISAANNHTCVVRKDLSVACFGAGWVGNACNAGLGQDGGSSSPTPRPLASGSFTAVAAFYTSSCVVASPGGAVRCAGFSYFGETGDPPSGSGNCAPLAAPVANAITATSVGVGTLHTCAFVTVPQKQLVCWGRNDNGTLGAFDGGSTNVGQPITGWKSIPTERIAIGDSTNCAIMTDGTVECFGSNGGNALGRGVPFFPFSAIPDKVDGVTNAVAISHRGSTGCVIEHPPTGTDVVKCWGFNDKGQVGSGTTFGSNETPKAVKGLP